MLTVEIPSQDLKIVFEGRDYKGIESFVEAVFGQFSGSLAENPLQLTLRGTGIVVVSAFGLLARKAHCNLVVRIETQETPESEPTVVVVPVPEVRSTDEYYNR